MGREGGRQKGGIGEGREGGESEAVEQGERKRERREGEVKGGVERGEGCEKGGIGKEG